MTRRLREHAAAWLARGTDSIAIEVAATAGSAPREAGTRMLVSADAQAGTIGGGHLELKAVTLARGMLARGETSRITYRYPLGPALGQCCGGSVTLALAVLDDSALAAWPTPEPLFRVQLHGAGHVGRAIATLLATIDCEVDWFDQRDDGFPNATTLGSPWPAHIRRIAVDTVEAEVADAAPGSLFLVLSHEHALDLRIVEAILKRDDFAFCGLIGSRTKRVSFARRLEAKGFAPDRIERITCPIGVDGVAGKEPEVIAAAVLVQLLRVARTPLTPALSRLAGEGEAASAQGKGFG